jgi:hypothetical protein
MIYLKNGPSEWSLCMWKEVLNGACIPGKWQRHISSFEPQGAFYAYFRGLISQSLGHGHI